MRPIATTLICEDQSAAWLLSPADLMYNAIIEIREHLSDYQIAQMMENHLRQMKKMYEAFIPGTQAYYGRTKSETIARYLEEDHDAFVEREKNYWIEIARVFVRLEPFFDCEEHEIYNMETQETRRISKFIDIYIALFELVTGTLTYTPYGDREFPFAELDRIDSLFDNQEHIGKFCSSPLESAEENADYEHLVEELDEIFSFDNTLAWIRSISE